MNRLVDAVALALTIRDTAQTGAGQETDGTGDNASLVANNVTEEVAGHNNTVQARRVLDHDHSSTVNELMLDLEVRELLFESLGHDLSPESAGGQDIGLVQRPHPLVTTATGEETGKTSNALNLLTGVRLHIPSLA